MQSHVAGRSGRAACTRVRSALQGCSGVVFPLPVAQLLYAGRRFPRLSAKR